MDPLVQKKIWDREQVRRIREGFDTNKRRLGLICRHISRRSGTRSTGAVRVLNIGIGNGYLEARLLEEGFDVYSLDPSENAVHEMAAKLGVSHDRFRVGSAGTMPFETAYFDFLVMSEVLEHLDDQTLGECLMEIRRVLRPQGCFIGTCPDDEDLSRNTVTCPHCGERFHRVGHVRSFSVRSLSELLSQHFELDTCRSVRGMHLNWKGLLMYWYYVFPFRLARFFRPSVRIPQHIGCHLFFMAINSRSMA